MTLRSISGLVKRRIPTDPGERKRHLRELQKALRWLRSTQDSVASKINRLDRQSEAGGVRQTAKRLTLMRKYYSCQSARGRLMRAISQCQNWQPSPWQGE